MTVPNDLTDDLHRMEERLGIDAPPTLALEGEHEDWWTPENEPVGQRDCSDVLIVMPHEVVSQWTGRHSPVPGGEA